MGYIEQRMNTEHGFRCSIEADWPTECHHIAAHHHSLHDGTAIEIAYKGVFFFMRERLPQATTEDEDDNAYRTMTTTACMGRGLDKRRTYVEGGHEGDTGREGWYEPVVTPNIQTPTANDGSDGRVPLGIDGRCTDRLSVPNNSRTAPIFRPLLAPPAHANIALSCPPQDSYKPRGHASPTL
ncbi:hypothetical protein EDD18DRAFT_1109344 [Armillaria luteobubalina]|uniref:Uncharacterized protein n=1 Tax=Armillaria luteobubalina TaxID=153913 RepID=A0AA39PWN0_9AGAR|nr:hypothetical protein EDD18DRAFT_1109344 [Armillaria luteobubalina]